MIEKNPDLFDLSGRNFLVTGASSGLGQHFARILARHGAALLLGARRVDRLRALSEQILKAGGKAIPVKLDVTDRGSIQAAFDLGQAELGPISGVINNAGIASEKWVLDADPADWERVMATNLTGAWWVAQEAAARMASGNVAGNIVNIASILGFRVLKSTAAYAISKAGVIQMTKAMALELARNDIQVNAIAPGYFKTRLNAEFFDSPAGAQMIERIPQKRLGNPEDLEAPLLLLSSKASSFLTGSVIVLDGGQSLTMA